MLDELGRSGLCGGSHWYGNRRKWRKGGSSPADWSRSSVSHTSVRASIHPEMCIFQRGLRGWCNVTNMQSTVVPSIHFTYFVPAVALRILKPGLLNVTETVLQILILVVSFPSVSLSLYLWPLWTVSASNRCQLERSSRCERHSTEIFTWLDSASLCYEVEF